MYYIFIIHSSVEGHLDCFGILAIVNSAAMNFGVHIPFSIMVFSGYMPGSGIDTLYVSFNLSFLRNLPILFSIVSVSTFPPTVQGCALFSTSLPSLFVAFFYHGHSDWCEMIPL